MSLGAIVTHLAWMAHRLVSSNSPTRYASAASCKAAMASLWNHRSVLKSCAISRTNWAKGSFLMRSSPVFWYLLISRKATVPGLYCIGFFTPPVFGPREFCRVLRRLLFFSGLRGCLPGPLVFRAVYLVFTIFSLQYNESWGVQYWSRFWPLIKRERSLPLDWPTPLGLGIGAVEVEGMALPIIPFPLLIGEGSGVEHTLVLGVELNSEITELKSEATPSEQPVWSITGAEK